MAHRRAPRTASREGQPPASGPALERWSAGALGHESAGAPRRARRKVRRGKAKVHAAHAAAPRMPRNAIETPRSLQQQLSCPAEGGAAGAAGAAGRPGLPLRVPVPVPVPVLPSAACCMRCMRWPQLFGRGGVSRARG